MQNYSARKHRMYLTLLFLFLPFAILAQNLEIHHINVGQGTSVLIVGPDGTTLLFDGGRPGRGTSEVVPYLQSQGITNSLDYMILSHRDSDHYSGLTEVINAGYDVLTEIYDNGSNKTGTTITDFLNATATTTAGVAIPMPLGQIVNLGSGATATCVAVNGDVIGFGSVSGALNNENDRSVGLLIQYGDFDFLICGDLGGGDDDNSCTGRSTGQVNVETPLVQAIMPGGVNPLLTSFGVEVHHVNHHGSESSTNSDVMNLLTPAVACISVGASQGSNFHHPRIDVVENVLQAQASCITAPSALVLQTEEGDPTGASTSFAGFSVGDIVITTDGVTDYMVDANGAVTQGPDERSGAGLPATFNFDGSGGPSTVVFSESLYDTPGTDSQEEWVELYNFGASAVDVSGWTITDNNGSGSTFTIPAASTIQPSSFFTIAKNQSGFLSLYGYDADVYGSLPSLNNNGDALILQDDGAQEIDAVAWEGGASQGVPAGWGSSSQPSASTGNSVARTDPNVDTDTFSDWSTAPNNGNPLTQAFVNTQPVAVANGPYNGTVGQAVNFSSAGSNDPDGTIVSYLWDFGDSNTSTAANPSHTYGSTGTFSVSLTVTDDGGAMDTDNTTASISTPASTTIVMSEVFYDTPGTDADEEWIELYNVSGSTVDVGGWTFTDNNGTGASFTIPANTLVAPGTFLTVASDQTGFFALYGFDADVYGGIPGLNNTGDAVILTDDVSDEIDAVAWEGGASAGLPAGWGSSSEPNAPTGSSIARSNPNSDTNTFDDWIVVANNGDPQTQSGANVPPVANANGPYNGTEGQSVAFSSSGSSDPDGSIVAYDWDFGDSNTSTQENPSHTYVSAGNYTVILTVTDDGGAMDSDTTTATIAPAGGSWVTLTYDDFESGWGNYTDGGSDCRRSNKDAAFAHQGTYCVRIRDDSGVSSSFFYTDGVDVTVYDQIKVEFWYYPQSMESGEDFWVQYYDGSGWNTVATFVRGTDFENDSFYEVTDVIIDRNSYAFPTDMQIRIMCDASGNGDKLYVDEVRVSAITNPAKFASGDFVPAATPTSFVLHPNYPNPFNPSTEIRYEIADAGPVSLVVYNTLGQRVRTLVDELKVAGVYSVRLEASGLASGIYFYRLITRDAVFTRKMFLMK